MHLVILVTLIVIASGRDISEARHGRHDILQISPPPSEINHEQFEDNGGYGNFNNQNRQGDYRQQSNSGYNRDLINNDRSHSFANVNQGRSRVFSGNVNQAFDGQIQTIRHNHGNFNQPEQRFINNDYSNVDSTSNNDKAHKYQQNVLQARRQEDSMVFENNDHHNRRKTYADPNNSNLSRDNVQNQDFVTFLNEQNNRPDQNEGNHNINNNNNRNGFTANSNIVNNANENHLKTTKENEVTDRSFRNDAIERENRTVNEDKWVWGGESKAETGDSTTVDPTTATFTIDDRAAFSGDNCPSGMRKFLGKCLEVD